MLGKFINHQEDSLTASVFTHLLHLPIELFWQLLRNACYTDQLPCCPGEPLLIAPWPNWNPKGTQNSSRVIPDLFLRFPDLDLIIEAKRRDDRMQSHEQWKSQLTAYANEYASESETVEVRMIALGGIRENHDAEVTIAGPPSESGSLPPGKRRAEIKCPIHMCRWSRLLTECQRMEREMRRLEYQSSASRSHRRTLSDLIDLFAWHGFQTGTWFADVVPKLVQFGFSVPPNPRPFRHLSSQLCKP